MTIIYILAILAQAGIIIYFLKKKKAIPEEQALPSKIDLTTYEGARTAAIRVRGGDLGLTIPENQTFVHGIVMDWDMGAAVLTLTAYITGAANMYLSTGPAITGGGKNPEVGELAVRLVTEAQDMLLRTVAVADTGCPARGCIRFYLLTNHGVTAAQEQLIYIEDTTSPWLALFIRANTLINEMKSGGINYN